MLNQMIVEKKNYKSEIIRIVRDILVERSSGFYSPKADKLVDQVQISEEDYNVTPEPEIEEGVAYEEAPWINKTPFYFPGFPGKHGEDMTAAEKEPVPAQGNNYFR